MINAFDQNGQPVQVPREEWRTNVLPGMIEQAEKNPDQLYMLIVNSLNDGFVEEMIAPAQLLHQTDTVPARGACMWAIVLLQQNRLDEAEQVLEEYLKQHGEEGSVLVNLAKVFATRGEHERANATLWRGLELEPNQENGLNWFGAIAQETGGDDAARAALERVRVLPGSWRAQLFLARAALAQGNVREAKSFYQEALRNVAQPHPAELLMQMSGDLGNGGHLLELIELTAPNFVPEAHGLAVGANLIKANVDTRNLQEAARLTSILGNFNRPDWAQALAYWNQQIAQKLSGVEAPQQGGVQIGMLRVDGPIWLPPASPVRPLFGAKPAGPSVTFLGGSAETPQPAEGEQVQISDGLGRMTRALPLFLAEQVDMRTAAHGRAMIPWAVPQQQGQPGGFIVSSARWPDETARQAVQDPANLSDYVVTVHVDAEVTPWEASLVFIRAADGTRIGELQADFTPEDPGAGLAQLTDEVVDLLSSLGRATPPGIYRVPQGEEFPNYLLHLEQLLAVRCAGMDGMSPQFLTGEREILEGNLMQAAAEPDSIPVRILLVETMGAIARIRPQAVQELQQPFVELQQQHPIPLLDQLFSQPQVPGN
jgi:tetratricopeptide (TPR) repeat protein